MENETINKKILNIWKKYNSEFKFKNSPLLYPPFQKNGILYVGCNPSNTRNKRLLKNFDIKDFSHLEYTKINENNINKIIELEKKAKEVYSYFNKFKEISKEIRLPWQDIDLFYYRETSQNKFKKIINFKEKRDKVIELNKFAGDQLDLFIDLLKIINPKVIVVANAFVSKIILNRFKNKLNDTKISDKEGFHRILINNKQIPIFFTSMLTQQRALDNYSYERLVWHIKKAINKVNL